MVCFSWLEIICLIFYPFALWYVIRQEKLVGRLMVSDGVVIGKKRIWIGDHLGSQLQAQPGDRSISNS